MQSSTLRQDLSALSVSVTHVEEEVVMYCRLLRLRLKPARALLLLRPDLTAHIPLNPGPMRLIPIRTINPDPSWDKND